MTDNRQDPIREWLGAYLDGELNADRRAWVEDHLATCPACQAEMRSLRALSDLLHADPEPVFAHDRRPLPVFSARRVEREGVYRPGALRWVPLVLFGLWAFLQAAVLASGLLLLGQAFFPLAAPAIFPGDASLLPLSWVDMLLTFFGMGSLPAALASAAASPALKLLLLEIGITIVIGLLFLSWLAGAYSHRRSVMLAARG
jgi:anti-sigma factor RsiW